MTGTYPHPPTDLDGIPSPPDWTAPSLPGAWDGGQSPPEPAGPVSPASRKGSLALAAVTAVIGLAVGAAGGVLARSHGSRPTLIPATAFPTNPTAPVTTIPVPTTPPLTVQPPSTSGSSPAPGGGTATPGAIAAAVDPSIVDINTVLDYGVGSAAGTGMILTPGGEILTNNHVINEATTISVTVPSTGKTFGATVVGTDPTQDVAVLQLRDAVGLTPIPIGDSGAVSAGDAVVALGNAGGVGGVPAAVTGTVRATNQTITASDAGGANAETLSGLIEIDAQIQPGDSGGPLVNSAGRVIGMDTAASGGRRFQAAGTLGFAIPIAQATSVAQQIESGQASATIHLGLPAFIGVVISPAATGRPGALVTEVRPGSPAARAGMAAGDTITSVGGEPVSTSTDLSALIKSHHPGDKVTFAWSDQGGSTHTASLTLVSGPAD